VALLYFASHKNGSKLRNPSQTGRNGRINRNTLNSIELLSALFGYESLDSPCAKYSPVFCPPWRLRQLNVANRGIER
jgi:hypothetical protein